MCIHVYMCVQVCTCMCVCVHWGIHPWVHLQRPEVNFKHLSLFTLFFIKFVFIINLLFPCGCVICVWGRAYWAHTSENSSVELVSPPTFTWVLGTKLCSSGMSRKWSLCSATSLAPLIFETDSLSEPSAQQFSRLTGQ